MTAHLRSESDEETLSADQLWSRVLSAWERVTPAVCRHVSDRLEGLVRGEAGSVRKTRQP